MTWQKRSPRAQGWHTVKCPDIHLTAGQKPGMISESAALQAEIGSHVSAPSRAALQMRGHARAHCLSASVQSRRKAATYHAICASTMRRVMHAYRAAQVNWQLSTITCTTIKMQTDTNIRVPRAAGRAVLSLRRTMGQSAHAAGTARAQPRRSCTRNARLP